MYAQITLAISDQCAGGLEGFAPLSGELPSSVFAAAVEDGQTMSQSGAEYSVFVDLMDGEYNQADEKCISLTPAASILDLPSETLVSLGRQRLAQINDECAAYIAGRQALSKSSGLSDASTSRAISLKRSCRSASVSLGLVGVVLRSITGAFHETVCRLGERSIKPQKITMLIEVVPSPRLNVVSEIGEIGTDAGRSIDDLAVLKALDHSRLDAEISGSCLAFDILPEDIHLLGSEDIQSLLHGTQAKVVFALLSNPPGQPGGNYCPQEEQREAKIKLTFLPVFQKTEARND